MNKKNFINLLADELSCSKVRAGKILNVFLKCIFVLLRKYHKLKFLGFGTFELKTNKPRLVKTPRGIIAKVLPSSKIVFYMGKVLKNMINKK